MDSQNTQCRTLVRKLVQHFEHKFINVPRHSNTKEHTHLGIQMLQLSTLVRNQTEFRCFRNSVFQISERKEIPLI